MSDGMEQVENAEDVADGGRMERPLPSLMLVMGDIEVPRLQLNKIDPSYGLDKDGEPLMGDPAKYFVQAKVPDSEAKVRKGSRSIKIEEAAVQGGNRASWRHGGGTTAVQKVEWDEDAYFVNKCREQITDFRMVGLDAKTGKPTETVFGIRSENEDVYRRWLNPRNRAFRDWLEDYLDWVAGRATGDDAAGLDEQFAVLGNG